MTAASRSPARGRTRLMLWAAIAIAIIAVGHYLGVAARLRDVLEWTKGLGPLGPVVFIAIYIAACVLFVPGSILTIGAGVVFGVVRGSIYVSIAATLGATSAFLIGRYLAREWVAAKLAANPRFRAIDEAVAREGWKIVGLTRLSPVFPFNLLNYAFGLTRVSLRDYFFASWAGMLPGTVMYVYIGSLAGDLARASGANSAATSGRWALNLVGFAATVAVAVYVARIGAQALREKTADDQTNREPTS
jgi:uncharacterized membrane protein YdjX (TVP38/TMEM64 family)